MPNLYRAFLVTSTLLAVGRAQSPPLFASTDGGHLPAAGVGMEHLGDVDGDLDLDLVGRSAIWVQDGAAHFAPHAAAPWSPGAPIVVFDAEGDGDVDVIAAPVGGGPATLFGNSNGTFTAQPGVVPPTFVGGRPMDWNGDGLADLLQPVPLRAFQRQAGGFVDVTTTLLPAVAAPTHVAFADIDADGDLDLVGTITAPGPITTAAFVLRNDGAAGFAVATGTMLSPAPLPPHFGLAAGDLDGNGADDLVFLGDPNGAAGVVWTATGGLLAPGPIAGAPLPGSPDAPLLADLDGVPGAEFVVRSAGATRVLTLRNGSIVDATATLEPGTDLAPLAARDLDGNGRIDLLLRGPDRVAILLQGQLGQFVDSARPAGARYLIADLDRDGLLDALDVAGGRVTLRWSLPTAPFAIVALLADAPAAVFAGLIDFDGDGDLDIVGTAQGIAGGAALRNDGNRQFSILHTVPATTWGPFFPVDIDRDGDLDLHIVHPLPGPPNDAILINQGGTFVDGTAQWLPAGWRSSPPALANPYGDAPPRWLDLDGDGDRDLAVLVASSSGRHLHILGNTGATLVDVTSLAMPQVPPTHLIADFDLADFDGDGLPDLGVMADLGFGAGYQLAWIHNQGGGFAHTAPQPAFASTTPLRIAVADLTGDGRPDLAVEGQPFVFENLPASFLANPTLPIGPFVPGQALLADVDGDGDADAVESARTYTGMRRQLIAPRIAALGTTATLGISHLAAGSPRTAFFGVSFAPPASPLPLGVGAPLWLDPLQTDLTTLGLGAAATSGALSVTVPASPLLLGADVTVQAAIAGVALEITSAAIVRLR